MSPSGVRLFGTVCLLVLLTPSVQAAPPRTDDHGDPLPPGALARLGTVRLRDSGAACVVFSPDGKTLISGGDAGLCAWDVATGKKLDWFRDNAPATSAQLLPDGKTLLTVDNNGSIRYWQAATGTLLREVKEPPKPTERGFFNGQRSFLSADGKVAGVQGSGGVRLWDTETGKRIFSQKPPSSSDSAALSPDGKTLIVSGEGNRAHLLELPTGKEVRQIEGPNKAPSRLHAFAPLSQEWLSGFSFSPDGKTVAAMSGKDSFSLWDVSDGKLRCTVKDSHGLLRLSPLQWSPDGKLLAVGAEESIRLFEAATGKEVRRFEPSPGRAHALAFSPDGKTLASAEGYTLSHWDVATGKRLHPFAGHMSPVVSLAFSPDGTGLASGDTGTLIVWDLKDRKPQHTFPGHFPSVLSLAYSPDGKILASGDGYRGSGAFDAQIRLWDLTGGRLLRQFPGHLNGVDSLAFSPDGARLASAGSDGRARVWDVDTGKRLLQIRGDHNQEKSAALSPDGKTLLVAGTEGELALWQADSGRRVRDLPPGNESLMIRYATFLPDGRAVLAREVGRGNARFNEIRLWEVETGRLLRSFSLGDSEPVCCAVSPDGSTLATGGDYRGHAIRLWDLATGKPAGRLPGHAGGTVTALAYSRDGKLLASGGGDTTVLFWDLARARLEHLWSELASNREDSARAGKQLAATPEETIPFLKEHLRRAAAVEGRVGRLIADLDADDVDVRDKASRELEGLGPEAGFPLRLVLKGRPSLEVRTRIEKALRKLRTLLGEEFQPQSVLLSLAVLEEIGTPAARQSLEELAKGPAEATVTREAAASLDRLAKHKNAP
jgi:WD40 repeat protein